MKSVTVEPRFNVYWGRVGEPQKVELQFVANNITVSIPELTFETAQEYINLLQHQLDDAKQSLKEFMESQGTRKGTIYGNTGCEEEE